MSGIGALTLQQLCGGQWAPVAALPGDSVADRTPVMQYRIHRRRAVSRNARTLSIAEPYAPQSRRPGHPPARRARRRSGGDPAGSFGREPNPKTAFQCTVKAARRARLVQSPVPDEQSSIRDRDAGVLR